MTKHYFDLDYNVNPNGKIIAIDKDQKIIQIGWGADGHLLIDPNSHAGCAELSMTNKQLRQAAQRAGYDDFCIAHQEAYNGECTLCADVARNRQPAPDVVCINHEAPAGERCPNCRDVPDSIPPYMEELEKPIGQMWEEDNSTYGREGINPSAYAMGARAMYRHNQAGLAAAKARISLLEKELIDARIQLNNLKK